MRFWGVIPVALVVALLGVRACVTTAPLDRLAIGEAQTGDPPGTVVHEGSIDIARGGPVIIGYYSPGPARLTIATRELVGSAVIKERLVIPAGPTAIRFAAPPKARLMWSPVGRRGDPEYVPASSLSPEPPATATFGSSAGAAPVDGVIAAGLLLVIVATLCMLARRRLAAIPRATWIAMGVVFVVACVVRWIDLGGHGQTWDEDVNWASGRNYITNILSLDASPDAWSWNYEHPPVMKYLEGIGAQLSDGFGPARALSAIWIALGCALLVPIGTRIYSRRVGWLAAGIAALLPPLVAHGQIVGHESPSVLWWSLAILLALTAHDGEPSPRTLRGRLVWIGVAIGVATASRFVNGLVGPLCLAILFIEAPRARRWRTLVEGGAGMPVVAYLTMYALWPRMWLHPIGALQGSLAKLTIPHTGEPFLGVMTNNPGPHYFLAYLFATLPLGILVGVVAWIARAVLRPDRRSALIMAAWFAVPLALVLSPVRQDGVRYVLPCVVCLAVMAAAGFDFLATLVERRWQPTFAALAGAIVVYLGITLVRIHPYYLDYFGEQVGGTGTVARRGWFETAWWGEGIEEAVDYVNTNAGSQARVYRDCIGPAHLAWFRAGLWGPMVHSIDQAEWIVTYSRQTYPCPVPPAATRVFTVEANGAILAEVWRR
jgi:4-amino-4-deoxy-L-arabinose transferase-like glycosyltransferase